ncbi:MAG: TolC family protein, partial [Alistipes sp.]|nr:TolC family protein [Alistipes sp.]
VIMSAAGSLLQPIFNARVNRNQVKILKAQQEEAELAYRQTILNAGAEVNTLLAQVQAAREKRALTAQQVAALQRAVESTELLMEHTSTTYLEVLTARQTLLSAELAEVSNHFNELQSIVSLYQALGGGREVK